MIKSTILLLLITYIFSEGIVNKSTYDYLKKTAPYEVKDWKTNPFRKISKEAFFSKYASKTIPKRHIKFGQPVSSIKEEFPDYYDARDAFPACVPVIKNQEQCGSPTAFAGAAALSFRFCMATGEYVDLSPQDQIACKNAHCRLGDLVTSWEYYEEEGLVSEKCFPFVSGNMTEFPHCPNSDKTCVADSEGKRQKFIKYKAVKGSSAPFESIDAIKKEVLEHGPIQAGLLLFESLLHYSSGIYVAESGTPIGWHALTILGWGEEDGVKYWIAQNSWGEEWGEKGYIRIGLISAGISEYGYAGYPDLESLSYPF